MSKPTEQNPNSPAKTGNPMQQQQTERDPSDPRGERKDFRETGQEADPKSARDDIKAPGKDHTTDQGQR